MATVSLVELQGRIHPSVWKGVQLPPKYEPLGLFAKPGLLESSQNTKCTLYKMGGGTPTPLRLDGPGAGEQGASAGSARFPASEGLEVPVHNLDSPQGASR